MDATDEMKARVKSKLMHHAAVAAGYAKRMEFNEGDKVLWRAGAEEQRKTGIVRGMSTIELPVTGAHYIIEDTSGFIPNSVYPYTCVSIPACLMEKVE